MKKLIVKLKGKIKASIIYFIFYPLSAIIVLPVFLIIKKLFLKNTDIKFILFDGHKIGHMTLCLEPFIKKLYNKRIEKKHNFLYIVFFIKPIINHYYHKLIINYLKSRKNIIIFKNFLFWISFCKIFKLITKKNILVRGTARQKFHKINNDNNIIIKIPESDESIGEALIEKLGIKKHKNWICISNRDGKYLEKKFKDINSNYHNFRDFKISSMKKTIEYFISKNYYVIRMGSLSDERLNLEDEMYIDYPFSKLQSDFLDIYLSSKCSFYFGSGAGISNVPRMFRRPMFMINQVPFKGVFLHKNQLQIFKKIKDKNSKKILSINDILEKELFAIPSSFEFKKKNVELINNTEDEILTFAKEAILLHENKYKSFDQNITKNQKNMQVLLQKHDSFKNLFWTNKIGMDFLNNLNI